MPSHLETSQNKSPLAALDSLPKPRYTQSIVNIVGVLADIKPVAIIEDADQRTRDLLTGLNLKWNTIYDGEYVITSKDEDLLEEMGYWVDVRGDHTEEEHREVGRLLGYPPTATDYFVKRIGTMKLDADQQLPMILPVELEGTTVGMIHRFVLSPDNWRKEVDDYLVPLERALREYAPETYRTLERQARIRRVAMGVGQRLGRQRRDPFDGHAKIEWVE